MQASIQNEMKINCNDALTATAIMRDPASMKGRLLPSFKEHLSLHIPTQG